jgi:dATP pyrophosphohydrolase
LVYKIPVSTLVLVHTPDLRGLLLGRADFSGYWQSVTGSQEPGEACATPPRASCWKRPASTRAYGGVATGKYRTSTKLSSWRHRYPPGTTQNTEHVFALEVPETVRVTLNPREHHAHVWLPWKEAAPKCFSWSNRAAIEALPLRLAVIGRSIE